MEYSLWFDVLQHGGYYCLLTLFVFYLLLAEKRDVSLFLSIFFTSVLFEIVHLLIPGRSFSYTDIGSNLAGISAAFFIRHLYDSLKGNQ